MSKKRFNPNKIREGGDLSLPEDVDVMITEHIEQAEKDVEHTRMQIRWGVEQVHLIKKAATLMGLTYQTYAKQVLFRQALEDIERIKALQG